LPADPAAAAAVVSGNADDAPPPSVSGNCGGVAVAVAQQHSSANTDELTVVAVEAASSLQLLHDVRMHAMGAAVDDDAVFRSGCGGFRNRSDAAGNSCSVCLGTSEKLSWLPPLGDMHGVGWITCSETTQRHKR